MENNVKFSVIVPVYNRREEVEALLKSLHHQSVRNFEVIVVDDGSTDPCQPECAPYTSFVRYFWKENEGRSPARNFGITHASAPYFVFFDSDCVIPPHYFATLEQVLATPCFGGPDAAHESFSPLQKAINFAMTSFLTTGGIRGGKVQLEKFTPRTFNMGFSRQVYEQVGGFREMFSEDIDMSMRIRQAGFQMALLRQCPVYHKRRLCWRKFLRQVYVFGMSRITLHRLYPGSLKLVHTLPAVFLFASLALIVMAVCISPWYLAPLVAYALLLFLAAVISTRSLRIALMAVPAAFIQLWGYGAGFIKAALTPRNEAAERHIRKGSNE